MTEDEAPFLAGVACARTYWRLAWPVLHGQPAEEEANAALGKEIAREFCRLNGLEPSGRPLERLPMTEDEANFYLGQAIAYLMLILEHSDVDDGDLIVRRGAYLRHRIVDLIGKVGRVAHDWLRPQTEP